jgi:tape measure domain-containing protein
MADQLAVTITARDEATRTLQNIQREVTSLHGSMNQMGVVAGAVGGIVATGLTSALGALSSAIGGAGGSVVGMSSKLEQAGIAFETMLGSAEKAQVFLADLQDFAAKTPFEFPELVDASKKMLAFGFSAQQVRPVLTAVGNAAAAMGSGAEGIDRITRALGQMQAKGMVQAEEILQLTEAGIPAWDMLAKKLGTDVAGAMDAVTKRTVTAATFLEAFQTGTAARFGDMMERQSRTFAGAMSTVKDTIGQLIGGAFQPFFVQISQFADNLAQAFTGDAFGVWAANAQEVLSRLAPLFGQFMNAIKGLGPVIQQFVNDHIQGFVAGVQSLGERVLAVLPTIGDMFGHLGERIERGLGIVGPVIEKVVGALGSLAGPAGDLIQSVERLSDTFQTRLGEALGSLAGPAQELRETFDALQPLFDAVGTVATRALGDVQTAIQQVREVFGPLSTDVGDFSTSVGDMVGQLVPAIQSFADTAHEAFLGFMEAAINAWNAVSPTLQDLRDWLATNIPQAVGVLREQWDALAKELGPTFTMAWQVIQPVLIGLKDWLGAQIPQVVETVKSAIGGLFEFIGTMVGNLANLLGPFKDQFGGALHEFNTRLQEALAAARPVMVAEAQETATAVGHAFVEGTAPVVPALAATGEQAGAALSTGVAAGTTATTTALGTLPAAAAAAGTGVAAGLAPAKAAVDDLSKSTDAATLVQVLYAQNLERVVTQAIAHENIELQANVKALLNAGNAHEAIKTAAAAAGVTFTTMEAAIMGNARAQRELADAIKRTTDEMLRQHGAAGQAARVGIEMARGIAQALSDGSQPMQAMRNMVTGIVRAGAEAARAESPSRETAERIGEPLATGISAGFTAALPGVISAVQGGLGQVMGVATAFGDNLSRALTGSMGQMARQAAQEMVNVREGAFPQASHTIGSVESMKNAAAQQAAFLDYIEQTYGTRDPAKAQGIYAQQNPSVLYQGLLDKSAESLLNSLVGKLPLAAQAGYLSMAAGGNTMGALQTLWQAGGGQMTQLVKLLNNEPLRPTANPLLGPSANAILAAGGGSTSASGGGASGTSGTGLAQAPITFTSPFGEIIASGQRIADASQSAQQSTAAMAAQAKALANNVSLAALSWSSIADLSHQAAGSIAAIPQAFSAFAAAGQTAAQSIAAVTAAGYQTPGLGNPAVTTSGGGNASGVPSGNTPGGTAYGALLALGQQVTAAHPELSGEAQARAIQEAMRTDKDYLRVVGTLTDTTSDLERQQDQATNDVFNLRNVVQGLGGAAANGMGITSQLNAAEAHLADVTNQLAAARTTAVTTPSVTPNPTQVVAPFVGLTGGMLGLFGPGAGGGVPLPAPTPTTLTVPTSGTGGTSGGSVVFAGDINVTGSGVSTAQDAAAFLRQVQEEARRQGIDLSRVGGGL